MIKIYLDWNVISQIKNEQYSDLKEIIFYNDKLLIPFSTSHIGDVLVSYNEDEGITEYITSDLQFISKLTKNLCLFNDGKEIVLDYYPPQELFQNRINDNLTVENCFDEIGKMCSELGMPNPYDIIYFYSIDFYIIRKW